MCPRPMTSSHEGRGSTKERREESRGERENGGREGSRNKDFKEGEEVEEEMEKIKEWLK